MVCTGMHWLVAALPIQVPAAFASTERAAAARCLSPMQQAAPFMLVGGIVLLAILLSLGDRD
jgi:hypothetical protein